MLEAALAGDSPAMVAAREYEQAVAESEAAIGGEGEGEGTFPDSKFMPTDGE